MTRFIVAALYATAAFIIVLAVASILSGAALVSAIITVVGSAALAGVLVCAARTVSSEATR
jgi:uncharacterized membrane protein